MSTAIIIAAIFILFVLIISNSKKKPPTIYKEKQNTPLKSIDKSTDEAVRKILSNIKIEVSTSNIQDDTIVDVTGQAYKIEGGVASSSAFSSTPAYQYSNYTYDPDQFKLGKKYKQQLNLSNQEVSWLNKFWNPSNVFLSIEGCCIATIKLYLATLKELNRALKKEETSINIEIESLKKVLKTSYSAGIDSYWGGYDNNYYSERAESDIFITIFKRAENVVRELFGHKRKISGDFPSSQQNIVAEFEKRLGSKVTDIISRLKLNVAPPDFESERELNIQNVNRWKAKFELITSELKNDNINKAIEALYQLGEQNIKNPNVENIYYEASKIISSFDKVESLKFYLFYLYHDLKSTKIDNKKLNKTIQKNLFETNEQLHDFEIIVSSLIKTKDINTSLLEVSKIYKQKRKKINLDISSIKEVQEQDKSTVELLNEYLNDEYEDENTIITSQEINSEEISISIASSNSANNGDNYFNGIYLNKVQIEAIELITKNAFSISINQFEEFCKSKGVFKNQLIDGINDSCYSVIEDVLIEEETDNYLIDNNYYKRLTNL